MRKLMEAVERIDEKWDAKGIAGVIYREIKDEFSPVRKAFNSSNEPYRASIYSFGRHSGLYNPETLDGSENYHKLVDELELLVAGPDERFMGEDMWPHDKPFPKKPPVSTDLANPDVERYIESAAAALAKDAIVQAAGVYDEEGPGEGKFATGAQSQDEYVRIAAARFLDKDYKKAIIVNFQQQFDEYIEFWLNET